MLRRLLITSAFVLLGSVAAFAQNGTANCPPDTKQVTREISGGIGAIGGKVTEVSCEPKDRAKEPPQRDSGSKGGNSGGGRGGGGGGGIGGRKGKDN